MDETFGSAAVDRWRTERTRRRRWRRRIIWTVVVLGALIGAWRGYLVVNPMRSFSMIPLIFESPTKWTQPQDPALVAEDGSLNGGEVGIWVGTEEWAKTLASAQEAATLRHNTPLRYASYLARKYRFYGMAIPGWSYRVLPVPGKANERYVDVSINYKGSVDYNHPQNGKRYYPVGYVSATDQFTVVHTSGGWRMVTVTTIKDLGSAT